MKKLQKNSARINDYHTIRPSSKLQKHSWINFILNTIQVYTESFLFIQFFNFGQIWLNISTI